MDSCALPVDDLAPGCWRGAGMPGRLSPGRRLPGARRGRWPLVGLLPFGALLWGALLGGALPGCAASQRIADRKAAVAAEDLEAARARREAELDQGEVLTLSELGDVLEGRRVTQVNRFLIIQVEWLRVEEVAETLRPILESRYGAAVRIVPHIPTNQLLLYIPPREELMAAAGSAGGGSPARASGSVPRAASLPSTARSARASRSGTTAR